MLLIHRQLHFEPDNWIYCQLSSEKKSGSDILSLVKLRQDDGATLAGVIAAFAIFALSLFWIDCKDSNQG